MTVDTVTVMNGATTWKRRAPVACVRRFRKGGKPCSPSNPARARSRALRSPCRPPATCPMPSAIAASARSSTPSSSAPWPAWARTTSSTCAASTASRARMEVLGRGLIFFSPEPVSFLLGVGALWIHKQLQATEMGHTALHGAYDRLPGAEAFASKHVPLGHAHRRGVVALRAQRPAPRQHQRGRPRTPTSTSAPSASPSRPRTTAGIAASSRSPSPSSSPTSPSSSPRTSAG